MKKMWIGIVLIMAVMLAACGDKSYEARKVNPDTDICKVCNMSLAQEKYAGQIAMKNGDYEMFDDLGCLMEYYNKMQKDELGKAFIKDAEGKDWLDVEKSVFVYDKSIPTPMSYGVIAFKDEAAAEKYVAEHPKGKIMNFEELKSFNWGA